MDRNDRGQLLVQTTQPLARILHRINLLLENDLLGRVLEGLTREPAPVRQGPMTAPVIDAPIAQQEGEQLLALAAQVVRSCLTGPDQVTDSLVDWVRHPHATQLPRPGAAAPA